MGAGLYVALQVLLEHFIGKKFLARNCKKPFRIVHKCWHGIWFKKIRKICPSWWAEPLSFFNNVFLKIDLIASSLCYQLEPVNPEPSLVLILTMPTLMNDTKPLVQNPGNKCFIHRPAVMALRAY
jgi:hypothetical protein